MFHETSLVATIVVGLGLAFVLAAIANRLKVSLLVGYLLAGVAVEPAVVFSCWLLMCPMGKLHRARGRADEAYEWMLSEGA